MYKSGNSETLKLIGIVANNAVFLSSNIKGDSYYNSYRSLKGFFFDGELAKETYKGDWFQLGSIPKKITEKKPQRQINIRYELKEGFQVTDLTPETLTPQEIEDEFEDVYGLYTRKYDLEEEGFEDIDFKLNIIAEIDGNFEIKRQDYDLKHSLLDKITTHPVLLVNKPCELSKKQSYNIIREHIKQNIDPKYAEITSDYDFCLTVKKKIEIEPEAYQVNLNAGYSRRKPKYETRFKRARAIEIYKTSPEGYQGYPTIENFTGKNADDLKGNVDKFLEELMEKINEPLVECKCCKGLGVVLNGD